MWLSLKLVICFGIILGIINLIGISNLDEWICCGFEFADMFWLCTRDWMIGFCFHFEFGWLDLFWFRIWMIESVLISNSKLISPYRNSNNRVQHSGTWIFEISVNAGLEPEPNMGFRLLPVPEAESQIPPPVLSLPTLIHGFFILYSTRICFFIPTATHVRWVLVSAKFGLILFWFFVLFLVWGCNRWGSSGRYGA